MLPCRKEAAHHGADFVTSVLRSIESEGERTEMSALCSANDLQDKGAFQCVAGFAYLFKSVAARPRG